MTKKEILKANNKAIILQMEKVKKKFTEDQINEIYDMFLSEHASAFTSAHKRADYYDGVDSLRDSYEMWIYESIDSTKGAELFIKKTVDGLEECFIAALT